MEDVICVVGGIIPMKDIEYLKSIGFSKVYTPGTSLELMVSELNMLVDETILNYPL